jgi:CBS domain-containing protein
MSDLLVKDIMTPDPVTAVLPGSRADALRLLVKHRITGVPVVRRDGTLAGFLARKHIFAKADEEQLALLMVKDWPSVAPTETVEAVARLMVEGELHHLPVTEGGKVVGIVTPADLMGVVESRGVRTPVSELLRTACVAVWKGTLVTVAHEIMRVGRAFALPVLDDGGRLTGIITDRDFFDLLQEERQTVLGDLGLLEENPWDWEGLKNVVRLYYEDRRVVLPPVPVESVMKSPTSISPRTPVSEAAGLMKRKDYGQLPVVDAQGRLLGMLTELDAARTLLA